MWVGVEPRARTSLALDLGLRARGCTQPLISNNAISAAFAVMLIICGVLVNGPYALITTAVSADLVSDPHVGTGPA